MFVRVKKGVEGCAPNCQGWDWKGRISLPYITEYELTWYNYYRLPLYLVKDFILQLLDIRDYHAYI